MTITPCRPKWKGTMTDRERFNNQMHYKPVDRCFNMEFGYWKENFTQWSIFTENGITNNGEADIFFNFDRIGGVGGNTWMSPPFASEVIEETETTRIMMNGDGLLAEVPKDGHDTIPHTSRRRLSHQTTGSAARRSVSAATTRRARSTWKRSRKPIRPRATIPLVSTAAR